jgi:hypothetical protein
MATLNRRFNKYYVFVAIGAAERDQGCGGKNMIDPRGQSYLAATSVLEAILRIACQRQLTKGQLLIADMRSYDRFLLPHKLQVYAGDI